MLKTASVFVLSATFFTSVSWAGCEIEYGKTRSLSSSLGSDGKIPSTPTASNKIVGGYPKAYRCKKDGTSYTSNKDGDKVCVQYVGAIYGNENDFKEGITTKDTGEAARYIHGFTMVMNDKGQMEDIKRLNVDSRYHDKGAMAAVDGPMTSICNSLRAQIKSKEEDIKAAVKAKVDQPIRAPADRDYLLKAHDNLCYDDNPKLARLKNLSLWQFVVQTLPDTDPIPDERAREYTPFISEDGSPIYSGLLNTYSYDGQGHYVRTENRLKDFVNDRGSNGLLDKLNSLSKGGDSFAILQGTSKGTSQVPQYDSNPKGFKMGETPGAGASILTLVKLAEIANQSMPGCFPNRRAETTPPKTTDQTAPPAQTDQPATK